MSKPHKMLRLGFPYNVLVVLGLFSAGLIVLYQSWLLVLGTADVAPDKMVMVVPHSLEDIKADYVMLSVLLTRARYTSIYFYCLLYIFKQSFNIPGSALLNVIAGTALGIQVGWPLVCMLSSIGASCGFMISIIAASNWIHDANPQSKSVILRKIHEVRTTTEGLHEKGRLEFFFYLVSMRLFPGTPNWLLNLAMPHCGVPLYYFFPSTLLGLMPYNFITVSAGTMLSSVNSTSDLFDQGTIIRLGAAAVLVAGFAPAMKFLHRHYTVWNTETDKLT